MNEDDISFLDDNAAVQGDDLNYNPNQESSAWSGDNGGYDFSYPQQQNQFDFNSNLSNTPMEGWQSNGTDWGNVDQQLGTQFNNPMTDAVGLGRNVMGGAQNVLSQLFSGQNNGLMGKGLSALIEGQQNKRKAALMQQLAGQFRSAGDPFGSQRAQYQQALSQAVQDPYSAPIVKNQVEALAQAQAIKDAAAGRRSNSMTSAPALLAEQAKVAQNYINSLYTPSGANISPNLSGYQQAAMGSVNNNVNGYLSPLANVLGNVNRTNDNSTQLADALSKLLQGK